MMVRLVRIRMDNLVQRRGSDHPEDRQEQTEQEQTFQRSAEGPVLASMSQPLYQPLHLSRIHAPEQ